MMTIEEERTNFESWYAKHCTESGFTMEASEVMELREDDHYGDHRAVLNGKWEGWRAKAQQVAVPAGMVLVPTEALLDIKNRVNTLATLSLKAERYSVGREIKQDIADMLAAAQGAKP